eukprot:6192738-Pleurochrysis_carterae.AAC.2
MDTYPDTCGYVAQAITWVNRYMRASPVGLSGSVFGSCQRVRQIARCGAVRGDERWQIWRSIYPTRVGCDRFMGRNARPQMPQGSGWSGQGSRKRMELKEGRKRRVAWARGRKKGFMKPVQVRMRREVPLSAGTLRVPVLDEITQTAIRRSRPWRQLRSRPLLCS